MREAPASADGNETNTQVWQSGSKGGAATRGEMLIGLPGKVIEPAFGNVRFDLLIPRVRNEILEPLGKSSQVRLRQPRHFRLQFLNAHGRNLMRHRPGSKSAKAAQILA